MTFFNVLLFHIFTAESFEYWMNKKLDVSNRYYLVLRWKSYSIGKNLYRTPMGTFPPTWLPFLHSSMHQIVSTSVISSLVSYYPTLGRFPTLEKLYSYIRTVCTVKDKTLCTIHRTIVVKLPYNYEQCVRDRGSILPLEKLTHFVLGPWLLVCQFIDISNQMETTGEVSKIEGIFFT